VAKGEAVRFGFSSFAQPGYAKVAWNFQVQPMDRGFSLFSTETRVLASDDASRRSFRRYLRLVGPFSGFIRRRTLGLVKLDAES